jgi:hypothetical protein
VLEKSTCQLVGYRFRHACLGQKALGDVEVVQLQANQSAIHVSEPAHQLILGGSGDGGGRNLSGSHGNSDSQKGGPKDGNRIGAPQ